MIRRIFGILLILVSLFSTAGKLAVFTYYQLNKDYIAANLCVKKDVPDSCCKGSCFLEDSLQKVDSPEPDAEVPYPDLSNIKEQLVYQNAIINTHFKITLLPVGYLPYGFARHELQFPTGIFHPPEILA